MTDALRQLPGPPSTAILACGNLLVVCPSSDPERTDVDAVRLQCDAMARQWGSDFCIIFCIPAGLKPPSQQGRRFITELLTSLVPRTRAMAWVVLGQGFIAAAVRSAIAIMLPTKVFGDIGVALDWMGAHLKGSQGGRFDKLAVVQGVEALVKRAPSSPSLA